MATFASNALTRLTFAGGTSPAWAPDGSRICFGFEPPATRNRIVVVQSWFDELKARVPITSRED